MLNILKNLTLMTVKATKEITDNTNIDNLNVELNKPFEPDEVKKSIQKLKKIKLVAMIKY